MKCCRDQNENIILLGLADSPNMWANSFLERVLHVTFFRFAMPV